MKYLISLYYSFKSWMRGINSSHFYRCHLLEILELCREQSQDKELWKISKVMQIRQLQNALNELHIKICRVK